MAPGNRERDRIRPIVSYSRFTGHCVSRAQLIPVRNCPAALSDVIRIIPVVETLSPDGPWKTRFEQTVKEPGWRSITTIGLRPISMNGSESQADILCIGMGAEDTDWPRIVWISVNLQRASLPELPILRCFGASMTVFASKFERFPITALRVVVDCRSICRRVNLC